MTELSFIATKKKAREQLQRAVFGRGKALGVLCSVLLVHPPLQEIGRSTALQNGPQFLVRFRTAVITRD